MWSSMKTAPEGDQSGRGSNPARVASFTHGRAHGEEASRARFLEVRIPLDRSSACHRETRPARALANFATQQSSSYCAEDGTYESVSAAQCGSASGARTASPSKTPSHLRPQRRSRSSSAPPRRRGRSWCNVSASREAKVCAAQPFAKQPRSDMCSFLLSANVQQHCRPHDAQRGTCEARWATRSAAMIKPGHC